MEETEVPQTDRRLDDSSVESWPANVSWMISRCRRWSRFSLFGRRKSKVRVRAARPFGAAWELSSVFVPSRGTTVYRPVPPAREGCRASCRAGASLDDQSGQVEPVEAVPVQLLGALGEGRLQRLEPGGRRQLHRGEVRHLEDDQVLEPVRRALLLERRDVHALAQLDRHADAQEPVVREVQRQRLERDRRTCRLRGARRGDRTRAGTAGGTQQERRG